MTKEEALEIALSDKRVSVCSECEGAICTECLGKQCWGEPKLCDGHSACSNCFGLGYILNQDYIEACALLGVSHRRFSVAEVKAKAGQS